MSYQTPARGPERKKATVRGLTVAMTRFNQMVTACGSRAVSTAATAYSSQPGQAQERQSAGSWDRGEEDLLGNPATLNTGNTPLNVGEPLDVLTVGDVELANQDSAGSVRCAIGCRLGGEYRPSPD